MALRGYHYMLGIVLLVPAAVFMTLAWAWRRLLGGGRELEGSATRQLRQAASAEFAIPAATVGYVIGRQGQRVKQLEQSSGARIRFKDQQDSEDKMVVISGSEEAVRRAEESVRELVQRKMEDHNAQRVSVPVPQHAIGRLIGRGGANIRALQRESGAKVNVPSAPVGMGSGGSVECEVVGSVEQIDRAVALLNQSIQQSELSRRRQALAGNQKTRKPATTPPLEDVLVPSYLPATSDFFPAFVSAVDSEGGVRLQLVEGTDPASLDSLVEAMTEDYSKLQPEALPPPELREGIVVAAPFPHDENWYRARVVGVTDSRVDLLFVDFGDRASLEAGQLRPLRSQYYRLPIQAIHCRLAGIQAKGGVWSEAAIQLLDTLSLCATWRVVMVKVEGRAGERPRVRIVDTTTEKDVDVAEQLVEEGVAEWSMKRPWGDGQDSPDPKVPVTLEWVDGKSVSVAGTFSNWEPVPLSMSPGGVYEGAIDLPSEGSFQYKFVVDGTWTHNPNQPKVEDGYGGYNNILNTRNLRVAWNETSQVCVAGTFSDWEPVPMQRKPSGGFESTLKLPMESSFEYKFVVNGEWTHVEDQPKVNDPFGGHNNVLDTHSPPP